MYIQIIPNKNPTVWLPAYKYPVAEPWAIGYVSSEENAIKREFKGMLNIPIIPPAVIIEIF